ncbi:hypothetical protein [Sediminitomix flava]|nr:hypothetical protein [Sediminitomix flava]
MKPLFLVFFLLSSFFSVAQHHHTDKPSTHGMLLFGEKEIFVSHLPMFHSPHDYQVIATIQLPSDVLETYLNAKKNDQSETVYTLVPEIFVLPEMMEKPRSFKAVLYKGHFERGGKAITEEFDVNFIKTIHFRKFEKNGTKDEYPSYIFFGNDKEQFAAHFISAKPDFDHIIELRSPVYSSLNFEWSDSIFRIHFEDLENSPLEEKKSSFDFKTLYLEFSDLEN